jgi:hypothetical protein
MVRGHLNHFARPSSKDNYPLLGLSDTYIDTLVLTVTNLLCVTCENVYLILGWAPSEVSLNIMDYKYASLFIS